MNDPSNQNDSTQNQLQDAKKPRGPRLRSTRNRMSVVAQQIRAVLADQSIRPAMKAKLTFQGVALLDKLVEAREREAQLRELERIAQAKAKRP